MTMTPTSSVQSQTGPAPMGKQSNAAPAEVPFNQVLSGEIANRQNSASTDRTPNNEADSKNSPDQPATASTGNSAAKETKQAESADAKLKDAKDDKDSNVTAPVSADLLALVANLSQVSTKSIKSDASLPEQGTPAAIGIGKNASFARTGVQNSNITAQPDGGSEQMASLKPETAFTSLIQQGGELKSVLNQQGIKVDTAKILDAQLGMPPAALLSVQQASLQIAQAAVGLPGEKLTPNVGTPAWDQALGQKIVWMAAGAQQSASLTLNPPDLGPLQVVLHVSNDQASATFISAHPDVRHALEAALPKLREMMGDAGIQLGQSTVSAGTPNQHGASGGSSSHASADLRNADGTIDSAIQSGQAQIRMTGQGMVDTFA